MKHFKPSKRVKRAALFPEWLRNTERQHLNSGNRMLSRLAKPNVVYMIQTSDGRSFTGTPEEIADWFNTSLAKDAAVFTGTAKEFMDLTIKHT